MRGGHSQEAREWQHPYLLHAHNGNVDASLGGGKVCGCLHANETGAKDHHVHLQSKATQGICLLVTPPQLQVQSSLCPLTASLLPRASMSLLTADSMPWECSNWRSGKMLPRVAPSIVKRSPGL